MNRLERAQALDVAMLVALRGAQKEMWTALPGSIVSYDASKQTAAVQTTVKARIADPKGGVDWVDVPVLVDCPILFPSGGGFTLTFPIVAGDECLVVFSSRCIDGWWQSSGVQIPPDLRIHSLSDGFVFVGPRSQPKRITPSPSATAVEIRSDDHAVYIRITADHDIEALTPGDASVTASGTITLTAPTVHVQGNLTVSGTIVAVDEVTGVGKNLSTHTHGGVQTGGGTTGPPT